jgi:DNA polymerase-3 subunit alpha
MGKKLPEEMAKYRGRFIEGCAENKIDKKLAGEIFDTVERFAGYGFNKAHSAAYAVIAAQTAYLKANYPVEFMAALCTTEMGNSDRVVFNVVECRRAGIPVLPPDVNVSQLDFTVEMTDDGQEAVRFGLGAIKNLGRGAAEAIVATRDAQPGGKFADLEELCAEVSWSAINRRAIEAIAKAGGFDCFGVRSAVINRLESAISAGQQRQKAASRGQMGLFDLGSVAAPPPRLESSSADSGPEIDRKELLAWEKEFLGLYLSDHPLKQIFEQSVHAGITPIVELPERESGTSVRVIGMVGNVRRVTTKKGKPMAILDIEDLTGTVSLVAFPECYEQHPGMWEPDKILDIRAKVDRRGGEQVQLICDSATDELKGIEAPPPPRDMVNLRLPISDDHWGDVRLMQRIDQLLQANEGDSIVVVTLVAGEQELKLKSRSRRVDWSETLQTEVEGLLGAGSIIHIEPATIAS